MPNSVLDQLLAAAQSSPDNIDEQRVDVLDRLYKVSETYEHYSRELSALVAPLREFLPSAAEYEDYAAPRDGKIAGSAWGYAKNKSVAEKSILIENPGVLAVTMANRIEAEGGYVMPELDDDEFTQFLDDVDFFARWWEEKVSADPLQIAKSLIVHSVLNNPQLRELVFAEAEMNVRFACSVGHMLDGWREDC